MSDKTYNGYTNYETWNCALWLDNDQGSQEYVQELTQDAKSINDLADTLKAMIEEQNPLADQSSMFSDILSAAISEINFYEMAENYWQDYHENAITDIEYTLAYDFGTGVEFNNADHTASIDNYQTLLADAITNKYPGITVSVVIGIGNTEDIIRVTDENGEVTESGDIVETLSDLAFDLFTDDWLVSDETEESDEIDLSDWLSDSWFANAESDYWTPFDTNTYPRDTIVY